MGRHRPQSKDAPSVYDLIAKIEAEDAPVPEPATTPIVMDEAGSFHPPPSHIRWAAVGVGALAATGLLASDGPATNEIAVAPISQATLLAVSPVTGEEIRADLSALQASRAEREAAEEQAQAVQAEADRVETERLAEEARQRAAKEAELARQQAAQEEATRESQRAAQEAAERAAEASTGRHRAEDAQEAQQTADAPVSADGPGAIVPGGRVTSGFGARWGTTHYGVDVAGPLGTPIYSPVSGTVVRAGAASGFGNAIYIEDSDGEVWVFGHMKTMYVTEGDHVNGGDKIALVGNEGQSTGPHVHIELHLGGIEGPRANPAHRLGL